MKTATVVISAAVIAAAGFAGWMYTAAQAQTKAYDEWVERGVGLRATSIECGFYADAWDAGNKALAKSLYGDSAESIVKNCRFMQNVYRSHLKREPPRT